MVSFGLRVAVTAIRIRAGPFSTTNSFVSDVSGIDTPTLARRDISPTIQKPYMLQPGRPAWGVSEWTVRSDRVMN